MRGGISVGPLFHKSKQNLIVGPSFIEAYLLESKHSIVPRVIIDNKIKNYFHMTSEQILTALNTKFTTYYYHGNLIRHTPPNSPLHINEFDLIIDYVSPILGRFNNGFEWEPTNFLKHLCIALERRVAFKKYCWLGKFSVEVFGKDKQRLQSAAFEYLEKIESVLKND